MSSGFCGIHGITEWFELEGTSNPSHSTPLDIWFLKITGFLSSKWPNPYCFEMYFCTLDKAAFRIEITSKPHQTLSMDINETVKLKKHRKSLLNFQTFNSHSSYTK